MNNRLKRVVATVEMYRYAAISLAGKYFYLVLLIAPVWVAAMWGIEYLGITTGFFGANAQVQLIGLPLVFVAIFLGLRIMASEISGRSLEIVYTVPGGSERVWWTKLFAAVLILLPCMVLLAGGIWLFVTEYPLLALQGALQAALFFLVLAMGMSVLFRSEIGGAVATGLVAAGFGLISGFGTRQLVASPFYNPFALINADPEAVLAATVQNRVGYLLLSFAILGLAFMRSNRREKLLSG